MNLFSRTIKICLTPKNEWPVIAEEVSTKAGLVAGYVLPLAAIGSVAAFISGSIIGRTMPTVGLYKVPIAAGIGSALANMVMHVIGVFILALIIDAFALKFQGEKNFAQAFKVAVFAYTPAWLGGVFFIAPGIGWLALICALYCIYLIYTGLPVLMKNPAEKSGAYTGMVVLMTLVVSAILAIAIALLSMAGIFGGIAARGGFGDFGRSTEDSGRGSAAEEARLKAAMEGLGKRAGDGKRVELLPPDELKTFLPLTFAGVLGTSITAGKGGEGAFVVSKAEALYDNSADKSITVIVVDTGGGARALLRADSGWNGVPGEWEDEYHIEKTYQSGERVFREKAAKGGGMDEVTAVLGDRFIVSAKGRGVVASELRAALLDLDLSRLETMK